jgi:hypothetical protein
MIARWCQQREPPDALRGNLPMGRQPAEMSSVALDGSGDEDSMKA